MTDPPDRGRLILWHGEPGTGKTWSLQALAAEWKGWCSVEYVLDPEAFLDSSQYMMQVLLEAGTRLHHRTDRRSWRLLILEDTGELLSADAKLREGQRLSRFLNVVDGFIGRGLNVLILVTTNEHIGNLHPAVARPGRCLALVEFRPFRRGEAAQWLEAHGREPDGLPATSTLSELYAKLHGEEEKARALSRPIGFTPEER